MEGKKIKDVREIELPQVTDGAKVPISTGGSMAQTVTIGTLREAIGGGYKPPEGGIPFGDLSEEVRDTLSAADLTVPKTLDAAARHAANANISDRPPELEGGEVRKYGYRVLDPSAGLSEQVSAADTVYEIRDAYDLGGSTVTLPEGCTLRFNGGSIRNGTLTGSTTKIEAGPVKIFHADLTVNGSWNCPEAYAEWFGASTKAGADSTQGLQKTVDSFKGSVIRLQRGTYRVTAPIVYRNADGGSSIGQSIVGQGCRTTLIRAAAPGVSPVLDFPVATDMALRDFGVAGYSSSGGSYEGIGIRLGTDSANPAVRCLLDNISIYNFDTGLREHGWLNNFNSLQVRFNNVGLHTSGTTGVFTNIIAEGNRYCGTRTSGTAIFNGGTIEMNGRYGNGSDTDHCGALVNGRAAFNNIFFEHNGPNDGDTATIDPVTDRQSVGWHIKAGTAQYSSIVVSGCVFATGAGSISKKLLNRVSLDRCHYAEFTNSDAVVLTTTERTCVVRTFPKLAPTTTFSVNGCADGAADGLLFEKSSWGDLERITAFDPAILPSPGYFRYYGLTPDASIVMNMRDDKVVPHIYAKDEHRLSVVADSGGGTYNVRKIMFILKISGGFLRSVRAKGVRTMTVGITAEAVKTIETKYFYYIENLLVCRGVLNEGDAAETKTTNMLPQGFPNTQTVEPFNRGVYTVYVSSDLDQVLAAMDAYHELEYAYLSVGIGYYTHSAENPDADYEAEYAKMHVDLLSVTIHGTPCANMKGFGKPHYIRDYVQLGNVTPKSITIPGLTDGAFSPYGTASALYEGADCLVLKNRSGEKYIQKCCGGSTAQRPTVSAVGFCYFDTDLGRPVWWDGSGWSDPLGTEAPQG